MQIQTRFSIGDICFPISKHSLSRFVLCTTCNNTGKVEIDDETFQCPACHGTALRTVYVQKWIPSIHTGSVVGKILCEIISPQDDEVKYSNEFVIHSTYPLAIKIGYMLKATGVGSGQVWPHIDCFATLEEAQAECNKRNLPDIYYEDETLPAGFVPYTEESLKGK